MRVSSHWQQTPRGRWLARGLLLVVFSLFGGVSTFAVDSDPYLEGWRWVRFGLESGLPSGEIYDLVETQSQTLWVLTSEGVAWYDGFRWRSVEIPEDPDYGRSSRIAADRTGQIVLVVDGRLFRGGASGFKHLPVSTESDDDIKIIAAVPLVDDKLLLELADSSLVSWQNGQTRLATLPEDLQQSPGVGFGLAATNNEDVWLSSIRGTFRLDDGQWVKELEFPVDYVRVDDTGNRLAAVGSPENRGVWTWSEGEPVKRLESAHQTVAIAADVGVGGDALVVWTTGHVQARRDGVWRNVDPVRPELVGANLLRFQRNGDLWTASPRGLFVCRRSLGRWQRWDVDDQHVHALLRTRDGRLLAGHALGVSVIHADGASEYLGGSDKGSLGPVTGLAEDDSGAVWVSSGVTFSGAYRWFKGRWEHFGPEDGLPAARYHRIEKDDRGRLWFLGIAGEDPTERPEFEPGAFVREGDQFTRWGREEGLPSGRVYALATGVDNSIWFGTRDGLSRWRDGVWRHWNERQGLRSDKVFVLARGPNGRIWFGHQTGGGGLGYIDVNERPVYVEIRTDLEDLQAWDIQRGADDSLWVATDRGLARYRDGSFACLFSPFDTTGGRLWPVLPEHDKVIFGTLGHGLYALDLEEDSNPVPLIIPHEPMFRDNHLILEWDVHPFHAEQPPQQVETRFRVGDGHWSRWSLGHSATLNRLPFGEHRVVIQAKSLFGRVDPIGTTQVVHIPPAFWEHPLFIGVATVWLTLIVGVTAVLWRRHRVQQRLLREREQKYRGVFDESVSAIFILDTQKRFIDSNQAGLDLLGYTKDELLGMHIADVDADPVVVLPAHNQLLSGERIVNYEHRLKRKDGSLITVLNNSRPLIDAAGQVVGMLSTIVDISERKEAEAAIIRARDEWERTFDAVPDLIMVVDEQQRIARVNKAMADRLGMTPAECIGWRCCELVHASQEPPTYCPHGMMLHDGREQTEEMLEPILGGIFATSACPLMDECGTVIGCVFVARDVTEAKKAEEERSKLEERLRIAKRMDALGILAAGIAHDFNNFLMAILACARSVEANIDDNPKVARSVEGICHAAQAAADLSRSLLSLGRREPVSSKPIELTTVVAQSVKLIRHSIPATIEMSVDAPQDGRIWVAGSATQLGQLIVNLALNAKDAMPEGGSMRIAVRAARPASVALAEGIDDSTYGSGVIIVEDNGEGMSTEVRNRLFDPFFTTKSRGHGTGLGMAVVHNIVTTHNGGIRVDSSPGSGTRVTVTIPACAPPSGVSVGHKTAALIGEGSGNGAVILLAEDDEHVRPILTAELEEAGYRVLVASDGAKALEIIRHRLRDVNLMILDVDLPFASGIDCLHEARRAAPDMPAVLISGLSDVTTQPTVQGVVLLQKPFEVTELLEVARNLLVFDAGQS